MQELTTLFEKYNFKCSHTGQPDTLIANIEDQTGFKLPDDYRHFIKNYDGLEGDIECEYVVLWNAEILLKMNEGYGIQEFCPDIFAIGSNGAGECIAFDLQPGSNHRLILADFIGLEREYFIEIGSSFLDMLIRLDTGKGWFE